MIRSRALEMKGRWWIEFFLDFSKAFDTIPLRIFLEALPNCEMSAFMVCWVKK